MFAHCAVMSFFEPVTFAHCTWPPLDQINVQLFFRDSMTIDFIKWLTSLAIIPYTYFK